MKVLTLYNDYRSQSNGEQRVVLETQDLLRAAGVQTRLVMRSSAELVGHIGARVRAFASGIYSRAAKRAVAAVLAADRPDIVHAHNLYPLLSPSVLTACREAGVPTVMSVHNFSLTCPSWDHYRRGAVCRKCLDGTPLWCALHNCRSDMAASFAYAVRSAVARRIAVFRDNVTRVIALGEFGRRWLTTAGFPTSRIDLLPNAVAVPATATDPAAGAYVAFAGRWSEAKGADLVLRAARPLSDIPFRLAGEPSGRLPASGGDVRLLGLLSDDEMTGFYRSARLLVLPSRGFEMCPRVVLEAMAHGLPVVGSRLGGLTDLIEHGVNGLLCTPGDPGDLAAAVRTLWDDPERCRAFGRAARERIARHHDQREYATHLLAIYDRAIASAA